MFSVPPVTSKFDPRLAAKFFEPPAPELVGAPKSTLSNIGQIRTEAVTFLFLRIVQGRVTDLHAQMDLVDHLLNLYSPMLSFGEPKELKNLTEENRLILESIQDGLLLTIKNQLTLEFVLFYILEKKIKYQNKAFHAEKKILTQFFTRVYATLYSYGPDPYFESVVDFNNSSLEELNAKSQEIYSHLMISLLTRLSTIGFLITEYKTEQVSESAWAFTLLNCKTITLIYVLENKKRNPLITYLQQPGKKNCDKVIYNADFLHELILATPPKHRLAVWQNSFSDGHLESIIKSPVVFERLVALFAKEEQVIVRAQFPEVEFLRFDPALASPFFINVLPASNTEMSLNAFLMMVRRGMLSQELREKLIPTDDKYQFGKHQLVAAILNCFAHEVGLNIIENTHQAMLNDPPIQSLLLGFDRHVIEVLTLSNLVEFIYQTRLKTPIENLLFNRDTEIITLRLNFYGSDDSFSPAVLFDQAAGEIECKILISLVHRLANSGFVDLSKCEKLTYKRDTIYYFPNNSVKLAFVNNERIPLIKFLLSRNDDQVARFLRYYPAFLDILDYFPLARQQSFYRTNCAIAHMFIKNFPQLQAVLKEYSPEQLATFFRNVTRMFLEKVLTSAKHYELIVEFVPVTLMRNFVKIIPIKQFEELHDDPAKFSIFISKLFSEVHDRLINHLSDDYVQNIHPNAQIVINSVRTFSPAAVKILYKKLGDKYLQCVFSNSNKLFMLGMAVDEQKYEMACNSFNPKHLRAIFNNQMSLTNIAFIKTNKHNFIVKLINAGCGCYQSLFADMTLLSNTLKLIPGQELLFVQKINIDFSAAAQSYAHLLEILMTFRHSLARVTFCLRLEANLKRFLTDLTQFANVYNLFSVLDQLYFQNKTSDFNDYIVQIEAAHSQKIDELTKSLNFIIEEFNHANSFVTFPPCPINDLLTTSITIAAKIAKIETYAERSLAEQLVQIKLIFLDVVNSLELAFKGQIWKTSTDQSFFGRPRTDVIRQLNSEFRGFHYTRFLGVLLHKIFIHHEAELLSVTNPLHNKLYTLLKDIKIPPAHDKLLFLVPEEKEPSSQRTTLKIS